MVRRPCTVAMIALFVSILTSIIGINVTLAAGNDMFSGESPNDLNDVRTTADDAWTGAVTAVKEMNEQDTAVEMCGGWVKKECNKAVVDFQSEPTEVLWFVYQANPKGSNIFNRKNLLLTKEIEDKILQDPGYTDYCNINSRLMNVSDVLTKNGYEVSDNATLHGDGDADIGIRFLNDSARGNAPACFLTKPEQCSRPLSPTNLFFASVPPSAVDRSLFSTPQARNISTQVTALALGSL
jgi:hypothetical protein